MIRVAFLSWRDREHPDGGGSEVYVESIAGGLAARGHRVTVFSAHYPDAQGEELRDGVRFVRRGGRLSVYPRGLWWILRHRRSIDVVVDVINGVPFAASLVRRRGVIGLIHHVHREQWHIIYPGVAGHLGWFLESKVVPRVYRHRPIVTVSESTRADLRTLGFDSRRLQVIHNGTPRLPESTVGKSPTPRLVAVARVVPHKRLEEAVDLVMDLRPQFPDLVLDIVGDGWWSAALDEHIESRGAQDAVVRHGYVDDQRRNDLLKAAWLLVVPSVKEGWCLAIVESALMQTPAVAYASAGGTRESIVDGSTGWLCADYSEMVTRVHHVLNSGPDAALGTRAKEHAQKFTWARSVELFADLIESAVDHSP